MSEGSVAGFTVTGCVSFVGAVGLADAEGFSERWLLLAVTEFVVVDWAPL